MNNWINYVGWLVNWFEKWAAFEAICAPSIFFSDSLCARWMNSHTHTFESRRITNNIMLVGTIIFEMRGLFHSYYCLLLRYIDNFICVLLFSIITILFRLIALFIFGGRWSLVCLIRSPTITNRPANVWHEKKIVSLHSLKNVDSIVDSSIHHRVVSVTSVWPFCWCFQSVSSESFFKP